MSQWNNGYAYNSNQYRDPNIWGNDVNGQYINQNPNFYQNQQFNTNNQYVSFNEFLSQMQSNSIAQANTNNYRNIQQFPNYPLGQYDVNVPSTTQNTQHYNYSQNSSVGTDCNYGQNNRTDSNQINVQNQYEPSIPVESSTSHNNDRIFKSNLTPTAMEFVPKSTQHVLNHQEPSTSQKPSDQQHLPTSNNQTHLPTPNEQPQQNPANINNKNHNQVRNENHKSQNHKETNGHVQKEGKQRKSNLKPIQSKESDAGRVFYNSSINKSSSQDVRNGGWQGESSSSKPRTWAGSQRLRALDRSIADAEQFANNYFHYKKDDDKHKDTDSRTPNTHSPARRKNKTMEVERGNLSLNFYPEWYQTRFY